MNMQAMMAQAQKMQRDIKKKQEELSRKEFKSTNEFVEVLMNGDKELLSFKILNKKLDEEDVEVLEDMISVALKDVISQIDKETEASLGQFSGLNGLI